MGSDLPASNRPRVLYVRTEGGSGLSRAERERRERAGEAPRRVMVEDSFGFDLLAESDLAHLPGRRGRVLRLLPGFVALALEVARRRRDYDVVVTWAEKYTVSIAAVLVWRRHRPRHLAILDWVSKPVVRIPLRLVRRGVDRILTWSSVQAAVATRRIGFSPSQIDFIQHPVDDAFFSPMDVPRRIVFSAGETQRDFPTLIEAVRDIGVPTVIAASVVGVFTGFRTRLTDARDQTSYPDEVVIESMDAVSLRRSYAEALVVVVPLAPAENNAGISVLLEAMAMGRPVVITRTEGQVDVVRDGLTGVYVPPGDAGALRDAIRALLIDREAAEAMGQRAREHVLAHHRVDTFATRVRDAAHTLAEGG